MDQITSQNTDGISTDGPEPIRRRRKVVANETLPKIGMEKNLRSLAMKKINENYYSRRRILTVPQEILDANPDKHFCYVNLNELEKNGFWHPGGFELFKAEVKDLSPQEKSRFQRNSDSLIHRKEMVLAWKPKEDYEMEQMEREVLRGKRDVTDVITKNSDFLINDEKDGFKPFARHTATKMPFPLKEAPNG